MQTLSVRESMEQRIGDLLRLSKKRGSPVFTAFLNEQEQFCAERFLKEKKADFLFWGGHENCVRRMLCILPREAPVFPVYSLTVSFRKADSPSHRDFLGSFLSLGIGREQIGDIFTGEGYAAVFCTETAEKLILSSVSKIGRVGVTICEGAPEHIPQTEFEEISVVVASARADCLVSALSGLSRKKSSEYIRSGRFLLNYEECANVSKTIAAGDIITLRGYGKFVFTGEAVETKKGRLRIRLKKYG